MPSSRLALSPRDCSSISPSPHPSLFGVPSGLGCAPFVPAFRHRSLSWQKRCARRFPNFSWVPQKAIPSRNSSPSGRTCKTCQFSAWLRKQKQGLLRKDDAREFAVLFDSMMDRAYSYGLWGAAYVIHGGCGDDAFTDFRASLISRGKEAFERAIRDPDSLADEECD